ncbi:MAG: hypothetical protein M3Y56_16740 [Armatimonadota bacterium]|nr:hypothetical protein [Armatimonadota bacterium]
MIKRIRASETALEVVRDTGASLPFIEPGEVEVALGGESSIQLHEDTLAPITLFAVREELMKRLHSSGGRPALTGTDRRAKIPLGDKEWLTLEELAAAISSPSFAPSAGQVASVLLSLCVQRVAPQISRSANHSLSPLAQELADHTAAKSTSDLSSHHS